MHLKEICKQTYLDGRFTLIENLLNLFLQIAITLYLLNLIFGITKKQHYFAGFNFANKDEEKWGRSNFKKLNSVKIIA